MVCVTNLIDKTESCRCRVEQAVNLIFTVVVHRNIRVSKYSLHALDLLDYWLTVSFEHNYPHTIEPFERVGQCVHISQSVGRVDSHRNQFKKISRIERL